MVRRPVPLRALALFTGLPTLLALLVLPGVAGAAAESPAGRPAPRTPLVVTIDSMTPSYLPRRGPVRITGDVTNRDSVPWTTINIYPFVANDGPIGTRLELAEAADTPHDANVGNRITDVEDSIDLLEPGQSTSFTLTVPRDLLLGQIEETTPAGPGVYWFGVHAIGQSENDPRDDFADGRARTFLPYVPTRLERRVKTALVLPLRHRLVYEPDGSLADPEDWARSLDEGRLRETVEFAQSAGGVPLTWLVDPAVPDAVQRLAVGNPARNLGPTDEVDEGASPSPSPSGTPEEEPEPDEPTPSMRAATAWLEDLEDTLRGQELLTLPYGDLDVAAAAEHDPPMVELARAQVGAVLEDWGLEGSPVAGSPSGYVDAATLEVLDPEVPLLVTDAALGEEAPGVASIDGHTLLVTSSGAAAGGPAPGDPTDSVALRQRILSEAALRVLDPAAREPLVVPLPARLPEDAAEFFEGLDAGFLELTTVDDASDHRPERLSTDALRYPDRQARLELDTEAFQAAGRLISSGETLQNLLARNNEVAAEITDQALTALSYPTRQFPAVSRASLALSQEWVEDQLRSVTISGPPGVTLSSADGEFVATVSNELDHPVTVGITARADSGLEVSPPETVELAARSRTSVLLDARVTESEVQNVTLALTDPEGIPLGSTDRVPIRSAQVSGVIWVIIGTGGAILFGAILFRLYRRFRRSRDGADGTDDPR